MTPEDAAIIRSDLRHLTQRFSEHAERTDQNFREVNRKLDTTNGRLRSLEAWRERVKGAVAAAGLGKPVLYLVLGALVAAGADRFL